MSNRLIPVVSVPEYNLTGEFCRKHFLTGLLLRELGLALQDEQNLRHLALATLKTLMAKHSLDARYATKVGDRRPETETLTLLKRKEKKRALRFRDIPPIGQEYCV